MKGKRFLVVRFLGVIILFLLVPAYIDYEELIEADFVSSQARYEARAVEDFSIEKPLDFSIVSASASVSSLSENDSHHSIAGSSQRVSFSRQELFILRC